MKAYTSRDSLMTVYRVSKEPKIIKKGCAEREREPCHCWSDMSLLQSHCLCKQYTSHVTFFSFTERTRNDV